MDFIGAILGFMLIGFSAMLLLGMLIEMLGGLMMLFELLGSIYSFLHARCAPLRALERGLAFILQPIFGILFFLIKFIAALLLLPLRAMGLWLAILQKPTPVRGDDPCAT